MVPRGELKFSRRLARFLENLTERDVADIVSGSASFEIVRYKESKIKKRKGETKIPSQTELYQVLDYLHGAADRETGFAKLDEKIQTKAALEALARLADLPVKRHDTVDVLRQNIIEATIGYKLRSTAVQGKNIHGSSGTSTG